ncbi:uncharacterized protein LOC111127395 [Crassostrea virginica]
MEHIGKQVKVVLEDDSRFEGFVHSMDSDTGKLTLHKVTDENGRRLPGIKHFFSDEIHEIYELENELQVKGKEASENLVDRKDRGLRLMKSKSNPAHLQRMRDFKPETVLLSNIAHIGVNAEVKPDNKSSDYDSSSDPEALEGGAEAPYVVINKMNQNFYEAVDCVLHCAVVGLAMQGVLVGRSGEVSWIQFATDRNVFLFDVLELPDNCFEEGIRAILENPDVLKVTHDCRLISDYLFHRHNIKLINIFDTQVADAFVDRLFKGGDWPRYVKGLADCAFNHLNLEPEQVLNLKTRERLKKLDEEVWATRPISRQLLDALYKNVVHLRPLRQVLMEKMMAEYVAGVDVYLSQVRDSSTKDAKMHQSNLLPMAFQGLRKMMPDLDSYRWGRRRLGSETSDRKGFTDNVLPICDPKVIISHDSIWHQGPYQAPHVFSEVTRQNKSVKEDGSPIKAADQRAGNMSDTSDTHNTGNPSNKSPNSNMSDRQNSVTSSPTYFQNNRVSPVKSNQTSQSETVTPPASEGKRVNGSPLKGLTEIEKTMEMQKMIENSEETEEIPAGLLIRSVLKQTDPRKLEEVEEEAETYMFRPAGVMMHVKRNEKTTARRQKEVDELELEMAQYVMENQPAESSLQEEQEFDDWGGTRHRPLVVSQENRDTILRKFLAMADKEKARRQAEIDLQSEAPIVPPTVHAGSNILQSFAEVRNAPSMASGTVSSGVRSQRHTQQYMCRSEHSFGGDDGDDDDQSVTGSDTLTQGSVATSHRLSSKEGQLSQRRSLYRGQISSKQRSSPPPDSPHGEGYLNASLPSTWSSPASNQNPRSVSLPATPACRGEGSSGNPPSQGGGVGVKGGPASIPHLSNLASVLAKTSIRPTASVAPGSKSPLQPSTPPRSATKNHQESSIINRILQDIPVSPPSTCSGSVQKPSIHKDPSPTKGGTSNASSPTKGGTNLAPHTSISAALNSTNSKIDRLKILAEAIKKSSEK